jgi:hypothetical protein
VSGWADSFACTIIRRRTETRGREERVCVSEACNVKDDKREVWEQHTNTHAHAHVGRVRQSPPPPHTHTTTTKHPKEERREEKRGGERGMCSLTSLAAELMALMVVEEDMAAVVGQ